MSAIYTEIIQQDGEWWIGWVEEIPGVNSQGHTREELLENLRAALEEALEMYRADSSVVTSGDYEAERCKADHRESMPDGRRHE